MEALLIPLALVLLVALCAGIHLYVVLVSTLLQHRRTMNSLHQRIERDRLHRTAP